MACHAESPIIYFFRAIDGGFINCQTYTTGTGAYNNIFRNMILSSDEIPIVYVAFYMTTAPTGYQIVSFPMEPIQATATWTQQSIENMAVSLSYGLIFGETEGFLYNIGVQTNQFLVTRIDSATGNIIWN